MEEQNRYRKIYGFSFVNYNYFKTLAKDIVSSKVYILLTVTVQPTDTLFEGCQLFQIKFSPLHKLALLGRLMGSHL